jgi:hypothetical protein
LAFVDVTTIPKVPSPVTSLVRSTSYAVPELTEPSVAIVAVVAAGWLFQLTADSVQFVPAPAKTPPTDEAFAQWIRSFTDRTTPVPTPDTVNVMRVRFSGLPSTSSVVRAPETRVGLSARTVASATGEKTRDRGAATEVGEAINQVASSTPDRAAAIERRRFDLRFPAVIV